MLDKAIAAGKEHRKPYYGTQRFDKTCRCHGSCEWCKANRLYKVVRREQKMNSKLNEYFT